MSYQDTLLTWHDFYLAKSGPPCNPRAPDGAGEVLDLNTI